MKELAVLWPFHFRVVKNLHFRVLKNLFPYQLLESWGRAVLVVVRGRRRLPSSARPYLNAARRRRVEWSVTSRVGDDAAPRLQLHDLVHYGLQQSRVDGCGDFG